MKKVLMLAMMALMLMPGTAGADGAICQIKSELLQFNPGLSESRG